MSAIRQVRRSRRSSRPVRKSATSRMLQRQRAWTGQSGERARRLQRQPPQLGRRRPASDLRGERQQRQYLDPRPGDLPGAPADRAVAASRPRPDIEGRPAGRVGVEPRRANPVCGAGGHQLDRRRQAQRHDRAAGRAHPDRLVAERRARQRRWQHPLRRECTRPRRHAQPQRRRLAQEQRDRDREHHPGSVAATARVIYRARVRKQRLRRRSTASRPDQSDPEPARKAERSDQARHLHQQGECDARFDARRHHR